MSEESDSKDLIRPYSIGAGKLNNIISLIGVIEEKFSRSHKNRNGEIFVKSKIVVPRQDGRNDTIKIVVPKQLIEDTCKETLIGKKVKVTGRLNSYLHPNPNCWLELYVFVKRIHVYEDKAFSQICNHVYLTGYISQPTILRKTRHGKEITEVFLGAIRENDYNNVKDFFPCFAWNDWASYANELTVGTYIWAKGRIRTRKYFKKDPDNPEAGMYLDRVEINISEMSKI